MSRTSIGKASVVFGAAALLVAVVVTEALRWRKPGYGYLLNWMNHLGLVRESDPQLQEREWRPLGPFDLTDDLALKWVVVHSVCFAAAALLLALWAEHEREDTLALSIGFILGVLALHMYGIQYSMSAILVGALGLTIIRRLRPNPSFHPAAYSGLRPLPSAGELKR